MAVAQIRTLSFARMFHVKTALKLEGRRLRIETPARHMFHGEPLARATGPSARRSNRPEPRRPEPARSQVSGEHHAAAPPRPPPGRRRADLPRRRGAASALQIRETSGHVPKSSALAVEHARATQCPMACVPARAVRDTRNPPGRLTSNCEAPRPRGLRSRPVHGGRPQVWTVSPHRCGAWNHADGAFGCGCRRARAASRCRPDAARGSVGDRGAQQLT
jgi:hypothetical protein